MHGLILLAAAFVPDPEDSPALDFCFEGLDWVSEDEGGGDGGCDEEGGGDTCLSLPVDLSDLGVSVVLGCSR